METLVIPLGGSRQEIHEKTHIVTVIIVSLMTSSKSYHKNSVQHKHELKTEKSKIIFTYLSLRLLLTWSIFLWSSGTANTFLEFCFQYADPAITMNRK